MTNPSQLKYLDAMGIPVWVSRDIVVSSGEKLDGLEKSEGLPVSKQEEKPSGVSSAESILQGLNEQSDAPKRTKPSSIVQEKVDKPIHKSANQDLSAQKNEIARTSSHIVYGSGNLQADWMVIGESPDINDDRQNQPYAGELGILLCNMLKAVGLENPRQSAYLVNVIKSSMQAIEPSSIGELNQILNNKIVEVKPKIILVIGQLSAQNLLQSKEPLARLRTKVQKHPETGKNIIVSYYPSYLLSKPMDKRKAWEDLKLAIKVLSEQQSSGSSPE